MASEHQALPLALPLAFIVITALGYVFQRLGLSLVVGYLATGVLLGPFGFGFLTDKATLDAVAEIGIVFLLFMVGLELSPSKLKKMKGKALRAGSLQLIGSTLVLGAALYGCLQAPWWLALILGAVLALSSTALVIKGLEDAQELETTHGRLALGTLIVQDMAVIPILMLIPLLMSLGQGNTLQWSHVAWQLMKPLALLSLTVWLSLMVIPHAMDRLARTANRELFTLSVFSVGVGMAGTTLALGLGAEAGAFVAGLALSGSVYSRQVLADSRPFRDVFTSLFFVSIGTLLNPSFMVAHAPTIVSLLLGFTLLKASLAMVAFKWVRASWQAALLAGVSLFQIGELSFMVFTHVQHALVVGSGQQWLEQWTGVLTHTIILSMFLTPFVLRALPALQRKLRLWLDKLDHADIVANQHALIHGGTPAPKSVHEHPHHALVVGYGPVAQQLCEALRLEGVPYHVLEMNPSTVRNLQQEGIPVYYGNACDADVLLHAGIANSTLLVVTIPDARISQDVLHTAKQLAPEIMTVARAKYAPNVEALYQHGADSVVYDELESGSRFINTCLIKVGCSLQEATSMTNVLREQFESHYHQSTRSSLFGNHPRLTLMGDLQVEWFRVQELSPLVGKTLEQASVYKHTQVTPLAIFKFTSEQLPPEPSYRLQPGDVILGMGTGQALYQLHQYLQ
ncbi:MAG: cation:proton antiporter [Vampirovibrionales bacterium]